jgi:hypothetical protein
MALRVEPSHHLETLDRILKRTDRFIIWPLCIPIVIAIAYATVVSFDPMFPLLPLMAAGLVVCIWLFAVLAAAGVAARARAWRRLASLVAILVCAFPAMAVSTIAGEYIHLLLALPRYYAEIAAAPADSGPIRLDDWEMGLVPSYDRALIYDSSDELASQIGSVIRPSEAGGTTTRTVRYLAGHFYVVEIDFTQ